MEFGKNLGYTSSGSDVSRAAGCTALCAILCNNGAVRLCSCKNNKRDQLGSTYYSERNWLIALTREPVTS